MAIERPSPTLENWPHQTYHAVMVDRTVQSPPTWLVESLNRSEAQIAAGQTVALEPVLDRLRASIARMRGQKPQDTRTTARKA